MSIRTKLHTAFYGEDKSRFRWDFAQNPIVDMDFSIGLSWWDYATLGFVPGNPVNFDINTANFNKRNRRIK